MSRWAVIATALGLACAAPEAPGTSPTEPPTPTPTFIEAEPQRAPPASDPADTNERVTVVVTDDLVLELGVEAHAQTHGPGPSWRFEITFDVHHRGDSGVFDLGNEPLAMFMTSVTLPDGTGLGSGGGCSFGSHLHGSRSWPLEPGERVEVRQSISEDLGPAARLEVEIHLCRVTLPDRRSVSGEIARLEARVERDGRLAQLELRGLAPPTPR